MGGSRRQTLNARALALLTVLVLLFLLTHPQRIRAVTGVVAEVEDTTLFVDGTDLADTIVVEVDAGLTEVHVYDEGVELTNSPFTLSALTAIGVLGAGGDDHITFDPTGTGVADLTSVTVVGQDGSDTIIGGIGGEVLIGDNGPGFPGNDSLVGGGGEDFLQGDDGNDTIEASDDPEATGPQRTTVSGGAGNDTIVSETDPNLLGGDSILGGEGADTISGSGPDDEIFGEDGDDELTWELRGEGEGAAPSRRLGQPAALDDEGTMTLSGGEGRDRFDVSASGELGLTALVLHLFGGEAEDFFVTLFNDPDLSGNGEIEATFKGHGGDDHITVERRGDGRAARVSILGQGGNDDLDLVDSEAILAPASGRTFAAASGEAVLAGGRGNDSIVANADGARATGAAGRDVLKGGQGKQRLVAGGGNDTLIGKAGNDTLIGGKGKDLHKGGGGRDFFKAKDGKPDTVVGGGGRDTAKADGKDKLRGVERRR